MPKPNPFGNTYLSVPCTSWKTRQSGYDFVPRYTTIWDYYSYGKFILC